MSAAPAVQWSKLHDKRRMRSSQSSGIRPNQPLRKAKSRGQSGNKCVNPGRRREDLCLFIPPWVCIGPLLFYLFALSACCVSVLDARPDPRRVLVPVRRSAASAVVCLTGVPRCLLAALSNLNQVSAVLPEERAFLLRTPLSGSRFLRKRFRSFGAPSASFAFIRPLVFSVSLAEKVALVPQLCLCSFACYATARRRKR